MIDYRLSFIVNHAAEVMTFEAASKVSGLSVQQVRLEIKKLNQCSEAILKQSVKINPQDFYLPKSIAKHWVDLFFNEREIDVIYSEYERYAMIYLLIFGQLEDLSVFHFQEFFFVSKNTVLNDLKKLRDFLSESKIEIVYSRKSGFYLDGDELNIRKFAYQLLGMLENQRNGSRLLFKGLLMKSNTYYASCRGHFLQTISDFNLSFVPSRITTMSYFFAYLLHRTKSTLIRFTSADEELLLPLIAYQASAQFLSHFPALSNNQMETLYLTVALMTALQGEIRDKSLEFLLECASKIIHQVERLAAVEFSDYRNLLMDLFYHLVPAYFRIRFDFPLDNILIDKIKLQYSELFEIIRIGLFPLTQLVNKNIPDDEVGYFTILFGGALKNQNTSTATTHLKALIVCPNGISSSLIMKAELKELFPQIDFYEANLVSGSLTEVEADSFDLSFSSVPITGSKKNYLINPILSQLEKNELVKRVQEDFLFPSRIMPSVDEIIQLLLPYIELKKGMTTKKLHKMVQRKVNQEMKRREDNRPMLSELLTDEMIALTDEVLDWRAAIRLVAKPLELNGRITANYVDAMIQKVTDYGAFIHIGHGVALPHARPEEGVKELGMSLLKVKTPVLLLDNPKHAINIFICLAAVDNETHLKALAGLTKILSDKDMLTRLLEADGVAKIREIIIGGEEE
ncbi:MAG: BglG family transcription antiterminator [Streptococcaceae bacterium]|jgi:transcriptional antiterminator/mannitol/fructose-specific phosphotransferase system IIA component (Ntr-type)|nr:BglG family transcription antiterminator [Streptococcaceae bacterium]